MFNLEIKSILSITLSIFTVGGRPDLFAFLGLPPLVMDSIRRHTVRLYHGGSM